MSNKFGIPEKVLEKLKARDLECVYCHKLMTYPYTNTKHGDSATIEHLREIAPFYWKDGLKEEDLVMCCGRCNSSRGKMKLKEWFKTKYCIENMINEDLVSEPVKKYLASVES